MRYIGCKTKLLDNIENAIKQYSPNATKVCDIFSGTSAVARCLKDNYEVISNDILYFSYCLQKATIENDSLPSFELLKRTKGIDTPIDFLNTASPNQQASLEPTRRLFQNAFSPIGERMYLTEQNALKIDYARNAIEDWKEEGLLSSLEYYYLIACVIEGIPYVSNIAGTYGAFNKFWDKRSHKEFKLIELPVTTNGKNNRCFNMDGLELLNKISGDVLYVDPPYNGRQYLSNYHLLETAAIYDFPEIRGVTGQRSDEGKKSDFCQKRKVLPAFEELMKRAKFEHIILSYSTEGLMSVDEIKEVMKRYGRSKSFDVIEIPYRRFKSRGTSHNGDVKELLIHIEKGIDYV